jgi:hypothetical protein
VTVLLDYYADLLVRAHCCDLSFGAVCIPRSVFIGVAGLFILTTFIEGLDDHMALNSRLYIMTVFLTGVFCTLGARMSYSTSLVRAEAPYGYAVCVGGGR